MTRTLFSALALTLLLAPLTACDDEPVDELDAAFEFDEESADVAAIADALDIEPLDAEIVACTPSTTIELPFETDGLGFASSEQAEPVSSPPPPDGGGGCGSNWIIYGNWINTSGCSQGGCPPYTRKQTKVDTVVNQCGIQYNIVHTRCYSC